MGMLPTHPSKDLISSVVGRSTKDEKSKRFHCPIRASVTSNQDWGNRLLTDPAEPTLVLQLVLSTTERLPRQHSLAHHSPGQEFSTLSLVALRPDSSSIHEANVSGSFLLIMALHRTLSALWAQSHQPAGGPSNVWLPPQPLHVLASLLGSFCPLVPPLLTFSSHC